jgi:hypothetical protein
MYLNIFDVFQGAKVQELLFAAVTFPKPYNEISNNG